MVLLRSTPLVIVLILSTRLVSGFAPLALHKNSCSTGFHGLPERKTRLSGVGGLMLEDFALTPALVASAAAAAMAGVTVGKIYTQTQIESLKLEVKSLKEKLKKTEELAEKERNQYEETLYNLDLEYESQTEQYQKQLQEQKSSEIEVATIKIRKELSQKFDVQLQQVKSQLLSDQYSSINTNGMQAQEIIYDLKNQKSKLEELNASLEEALAAARSELDLIQKTTKKGSFGAKVPAKPATSKKSSWW
jgi:hypothetical protein